MSKMTRNVQHSLDAFTAYLTEAQIDQTAPGYNAIRNGFYDGWYGFMPAINHNERYAAAYEAGCKAVVAQYGAHLRLL